VTNSHNIELLNEILQKHFIQVALMVCFCKLHNRALVEATESGGIVFFAPWTRHIAPKLVGYTAMKKILDYALEFFSKSVDNHKQSHSEDHSRYRSCTSILIVPITVFITIPNIHVFSIILCRDFIDVFLNEMKKKSSSSAFQGTEADKNLVSVVVDLFMAGSDTTSTTLDFAFVYLASFPETQEKLQKEIKDITGNSRFVSLTDRPK